MQHFFRKVEREGGATNFYFNKIHTVEGDRFHISAFDTHKKAYSFLMKQVGDVWKITNPYNCPDWIVKAEYRLSQIIIETIKI